MASIFSRIVRGEIPCHKVAESRTCLAFLDINPVTRGHTLAIPKKEVDYLFDLDDTTYSDLLLFSKKVALAIGKVIPCARVGVAVVGLEVPHAHVHLIPINAIADLSFTRGRASLTPQEMEDTAALIRNACEDIS